MMDNNPQKELVLWCTIHDEPTQQLSPFQVTISAKANVDTFKVAIKGKKTHALAQFDPDTLDLWKVRS